MARPKIPRKSTAVDMTAMCDVAFLLLSFFILVTKFKPAEAITVTTPNSVASKPAPDKNVVMVIINKDGKVFLSISDDNKDAKTEIANQLNDTKHLGLDVAAFANAQFYGSSFSQLPSFLQIPEKQRQGANLPGIPVDSTKGANEMIEWMGLIKTALAGKTTNLILKGDNMALYPSFKGIIDAFKKNDFMKFDMVTNPQAVPFGSELYNSNLKSGQTGG
jgi:biopolymer transport protein ExbD